MPSRRFSWRRSGAEPCLSSSHWVASGRCARDGVRMRQASARTSGPPPGSRANGSLDCHDRGRPERRHGFPVQARGPRQHRPRASDRDPRGGGVPVGRERDQAQARRPFRVHGLFDPGAAPRRVRSRSSRQQPHRAVDLSVRESDRAPPRRAGGLGRAGRSSGLGSSAWPGSTRTWSWTNLPGAMSSLPSWWTGWPMPWRAFTNMPNPCRRTAAAQVLRGCSRRTQASCRAIPTSSTRRRWRILRPRQARAWRCRLPDSSVGAGTVSCAAATAICTCATSASSTANRPSSMRSSSARASPASTSSTTWRSC